MFLIPVNTPFKLLDNDKVSGPNAVVLTFRFDSPISKLYLQGAQIKRYDDIPSQATYQLFEGLGVDEPGGISGSSVWTSDNSAYNLATLSTVTTPGLDGCAVYKVRLYTTTTSTATYDLAVLGVAK